MQEGGKKPGSDVTFVTCPQVGQAARRESRDEGLSGRRGPRLRGALGKIDQPHGMFFMECKMKTGFSPTAARVRGLINRSSREGFSWVLPVNLLAVLLTLTLGRPL